MSLPVTPHRLQLTPEQLAHARKIAHSHAAPHREVLRAKLTLVVHEHPEISHAQAGQRCGLDRFTVYSWRRRWAEEGWSLHDAPRPGRPRTFSPAGDRAGESLGL